MQMVAEGTLDLLSEHLYVKDKVCLEWHVLMTNIFLLFRFL